MAFLSMDRELIRVDPKPVPDNAVRAEKGVYLRSCPVCGASIGATCADLAIGFVHRRRVDELDDIPF